MTCQLPVQQIAYVFNRRVLEEIVPGPVVIGSQNAAHGGFQVGEIHDHAFAHFALDDEFDFVGMSVKRATFGMAGQEVSAVNVVDDADLHVDRPGG